ncbi:hypothetical protein D1872_271290 [compost metagenome]
MVLLDDLRVFASHENTAYRKSTDVFAFRNTRLLQQMQAASARSDKDELGPVALGRPALEVFHRQFP